MTPSHRSRRRFWLRLLRRVGLFGRADRVFLLLVPLVGVATGLIAVGITELIHLTQELFWGSRSDILHAAQASSSLHRFLAPTLGGLAIGLIILVARRPLAGGGVGHLVEAVALRGGYVATARTLLVQTIAIFTVGCGGSAGREGPLTVCGAMFASKAGRSAGLRGNPLKILVGCGAAAGMAAAYNAPIGGAIFGMEVVLGNFALETFGPIVISSVIATAISRRLIFGVRESVYLIPAYQLESSWLEFALFALLGVVAGGLAAVFIDAMDRGDRLFEWIRSPTWRKPILGFGLVGGIGVLCPYIYGNGFETVDLNLSSGLLQNIAGTDIGHAFGSYAWALLLLLPLVKLIATSVTLGSGGSGGLFTPSLFVGSLVGSAFGLAAVHYQLPGVTDSIVPFALVGMGAIAAATTKAPISAILIIYEITRSYTIILPLMIACIISNLVTKRFKDHSLFTRRLARRGVELPHRLEELVLETMTAQDLVREDRLTLRPRDTVPEILDRFLQTRRNHLYVIGARSSFAGAVSMHDLKQVLLQSRELTFILSHDIMYPDFPHVLAGDRLTKVLAEFAQHDHERLPVLENAASRKFLGHISKRDLMSVYNQEVLQRSTMLAKFTTSHEEGGQPTWVELPPQYRLDQVAAGDPLRGRTLAEIDLPRRHGIHVLEIKRLDDQGLEIRLVPDGTTRIEAGDRLVVLGRNQQITRLQALAEDDSAERQDAD